MNNLAHSAAIASLLSGLALAQTAARPQTPAPPAEQSGQVSLTYMGTAAWEISDGTTVILIDPYLSRILVPPPGPGSAALGRVPGDSRPLHGWDDIVAPDVAAIDAHIHRADFVLVTHTRLDHVMDVPHMPNESMPV